MARPAVCVRRADGADVPVLVALLSLARAEDAGPRRGSLALPPDLDAGRLASVVNREDVQVLLAESTSAGSGQLPVPVGVLVLRHGELVALDGQPAVHVEQLWVHPDHRRRGVARTLLRSAAAIGEQYGLDELVCAVPPHGREAHRFLARLGFAPLVTQRAVPVASLLRRLSNASQPVRRRVRLDQAVIRRRREQRSAASPSVSV